MKSFKPLLIASFILITGYITMGQTYTINGSVTGLPDSTWLYLRTAKPEKQLDSTMIINGQFNMSGQIPVKAIQVYLYTQKYTNYVGFWLENKDLSMSLKAGEFKKSVIKGSATQDEYAKMNNALDIIRSKRDSLADKLKTTTDPEARKLLEAQMQNVTGKVEQFYIDYVKGHGQSLIAAYLLNVYASTWGKDKAAVLYTGLSRDLQVSGYGIEIREYLTLNKNLKTGDKFVDFEQVNAAGKLVKLSDVKGRFILLDFWASWCAPCRQDNPGVVEMYQQFKDKGFAILGVSLDDNKAFWLAALKEDKLTWENVSDLRGDKNRAALIYGVNAIPTNYLIGQNGIIIAKNLRGEALRKKLQELMP